MTTHKDLTESNIPVTYTRMVAREMGLQERELPKLLWNTGLGPADITRDSTLISAIQQNQIARNALRMSGPWFGLNVGTRLTPPTHGAIGFLAHSSPNLRTALHAFQEFLPSRIRFLSIQLEETSSDLECVFEINLGSDSVIHRSLCEVIGLSIMSLVEFVLGEPLQRGAAYFNYPAPSYRDRYQQHFSCPVYFDAPESKLVIPLELCDLPSTSADHDAYHFALKQCQEMLEQLPNTQDTTKNRVINLLLSRPPSQWSEENIAAHLFISKRTLARRLKKENTGFWQIKDDLRASMAASYLLESQLSIEAIAMLLAFHDAPNFRRAFKRWHGVTPSAYREKHLTTAQPSTD